MQGWGLLLLAGLTAAGLGRASASPSGQGEAALLAELAAASGRPAVLLPMPSFVRASIGASLPRTRISAEARRQLEPVAAAAAAAHGVDVDFFKRLIRQESGYNPTAVSPAGAQGIAQFMPGTAAMVGLDDPFDPVKALPKSAELVATLNQRFGNQGLAAAAYNAGEGRVRAWLAGRAGLPLETQLYVAAVTGRQASEWAPAGTVLPTVATTRLGRAQVPIFAQIQSGEWQLGAKLLGSGGQQLATLLDTAGYASGRRGAGPVARAAGRRLTASGERALCESLRASGCIVAKVY